MPQKTKHSSAAYNFKVVLLGEGCVGKTSLVMRYVEDKFNSAHISTLQASFVTKRIILPDEKESNLSIWDTAGQERFHALGPIYYRGAHGAVIVFDITDNYSFQKVKNWVRELKRMLGDNLTITIAGNKIDLESQRAVQYAAAAEYAESVGAHYYETSAKKDEGVQELFEGLVKLLIKRQLLREPETHESKYLQSDYTDCSRQLTVAVNHTNEDNDGFIENMSDNSIRNTSYHSCCGTG